MPVRLLRTGSASHGARSTGWRIAEFLLYASLAADLVMLAASRGSHLMPPLIGMSFGLYGVVGTGLAVRASLHRGLDRGTRRAWAVMAVAMALVLASSILRRTYPIGAAFPSPADILRLLFAPVLLVGLLMLPMRTPGRRERHKAWLDTAVVVIAGGMEVCYLRIGPASGAGNVTIEASAAALAYPVTDLMLVFGASVVLFRGAAESARRPAKLLGVAMTALAVGDTLLGYRQSRTASIGADQWQFACWMVGHFMLGMAALAQCRQAGRHRLDVEPPRIRAVSLLPYLAIGLSYLLMLLTVHGLPARVVAMVAGGIAITSLVVARQVMAAREHHHLAITDTLTGLHNRRQLYDVLRLALARGARNGQHVAGLLLDLNGFKQVNDTMGHEAGDQLLIAFAGILRRNVLGLDAVGRLGGDEFAIVLHGLHGPADAQPVVDRIMADLCEALPVAGTSVRACASIGVALSAPGELTADQILHRADLAMYQAKATTRQTRATAFAFYEQPVSDPIDAAAVH